MEEDHHVFEDGDALDELQAGAGRMNTTMLRVLCILTWVYSFFSILGYLAFLGNFTNVKNLIQVGNNSNTILFLGFFLLPLICSVGALFMFRLEKWGFFIYLLGQLPPIGYKFYMSIVVEKITGPSLVFIIITNCIPIGFIILYFSQLHVMKPIFKRREY